MFIKILDIDINKKKTFKDTFIVSTVYNIGTVLIENMTQEIAST